MVKKQIEHPTEGEKPAPETMAEWCERIEKRKAEYEQVGDE
jgi:hypothetical protein